MRSNSSRLATKFSLNFWHSGTSTHSLSTTTRLAFLSMWAATKHSKATQVLLSQYMQKTLPIENCFHVFHSVEQQLRPVFTMINSRHCENWYQLRKFFVYCMYREIFSFSRSSWDLISNVIWNSCNFFRQASKWENMIPISGVRQGLAQYFEKYGDVTYDVSSFWVSLYF